MRAVGYRTMKAPSTAAIAPLAPSVGTCAADAEPKCRVTTACVIVATKPPAM